MSRRGHAARGRGLRQPSRSLAPKLRSWRGVHALRHADEEWGDLLGQRSPVLRRPFLTVRPRFDPRRANQSPDGDVHASAQAGWNRHARKVAPEVGAEVNHFAIRNAAQQVTAASLAVRICRRKIYDVQWLQLVATNVA